MRAAAAAVGLLLVLVFALPALGAQPRRASLELRSTNPVVVLGRGFSPREPVLLTATAGTVQRIVPLIARRNGTFKARFRMRLEALCTGDRPCGRHARQPRDPAGRPGLSKAAGSRLTGSRASASGQPPGWRTPFTLSEYGAYRAIDSVGSSYITSIATVSASRPSRSRNRNFASSEYVRPLFTGT